MQYPPFYDNVKTITLYDPLSEFLGAFENGTIEVRYIDCVKLAGHSCPTVAGAYLMGLLGLKALYPDSLPQRGLIEVTLQSPENEGVTGVIGAVIGFIAGASGIGGFKGIQGKFARNNLLRYDEAMQGEVTLKRVDTGVSVLLSYNPSIIPADPLMMPLMGKMLQGMASKDEAQKFGELWQKRVEKILLGESLWKEIITIK